MLLNIEDSPQFESHIAGFESETEWLLGRHPAVLSVAVATAAAAGRKLLSYPVHLLVRQQRAYTRMPLQRPVVPRARCC